MRPLPMLVLLLASCAGVPQTARTHFEGPGRFDGPLPSRMLVLAAPLQAEVFDVEGFRVDEASTEKATALARQILADLLDERGVSAEPTPALGADDELLRDEWTALAGIVLDEAASYPDPLMAGPDQAAWRHKVERFDYEVGPAAWAPARLQAGTALIVTGFYVAPAAYYRDLVAFGRGYRLVLGLVDLRTGRVMRMDRLQSRNDESRDRDFTQRMQLEPYLRELLTRLVGLGTDS